MDYKPPRVKIEQRLTNVTSPLVEPMMPFCIIGQSKVVVKKEHVDQESTRYIGKKMSVPLGVDSENTLLKRNGVYAGLFVQVMSSGSPLQNIELVQKGYDSIYGTGSLSSQIAADATSIPYSDPTGVAVTYTGTPTFLIKIENEIIEVNANNAGTMTAVKRGAKNTIAAAHDSGKAISFYGNNPYYIGSSSQGKIGNLTQAQINALSEGDIILKVPTGGSALDTVHRAHIINKFAPDNGADIHRNIITIDDDLEFNVDDREPTEGNDFFNAFSDVVSVSGYIKSTSLYESDYVTGNESADYLAEITNDSIILPAQMVDNSGELIKNAVIITEYTTYSSATKKGKHIINKPLLVSTVEQIEKFYGETIPENPLAYAVLLAISSGTAGYAIATAGDSLADFTIAIKAAEDIKVHQVAVLTDDKAKATILSAHVKSMSNSDNSKFRIGIISMKNLEARTTIAANAMGTVFQDNSGAYTKFAFYPEIPTVQEGDSLVVDDDNTPEVNGSYSIVDSAAGATSSLCKEVTIDGAFYPIVNYNTIVEFVNGGAGSHSVEFSGSVVMDVGTLFYVHQAAENGNKGWYSVTGNPSPGVFTVEKLTGGAIVSDSGETARATISTQISCEVERENSEYALAMSAKNASESIGERRVMNLFPHQCQFDRPDVLPTYFAAAALAGYIAANPGPLPFNETTIPGLSKVFGSSDVMSSDSLDIVAGGGTAILYQPGVDSVPILREQLMTDMSSMLTNQLSLVVNSDYISYMLLSVLKPRAGKNNLTADTIASVKIVVVQVLDYLMTAQGGSRISSYTDPVITIDTASGCVKINSELKLVSIDRDYDVALSLSI